MVQALATGLTYVRIVRASRTAVAHERTDCDTRLFTIVPQAAWQHLDIMRP